MSWWARQDSNLQPSGYEPLALTVELRALRRAHPIIAAREIGIRVGCADSTLASIPVRHALVVQHRRTGSQARICRIFRRNRLTGDDSQGTVDGLPA